jgi:hypothetical protein
MEWGLQNEFQPKTDRAHVEAEMLVDLNKLVLVADIDFVHIVNSLKDMCWNMRAVHF